MTQTPPKQNNNWRNLFQLTILTTYIHAFMEWLFFVTKPSSLSILTLFEKLKVLFITGGIIALIIAATLVLILVPTWLTKKEKLRFLGFIPSAFTLSITVLILFDNFTYTVFKFGVINAADVFRAVYGLGFILVFWRMIRFVQPTTPTLKKTASFITVSLLALSTAGILSTYFSNNLNVSSDSSSASNDLPNIIILGGDGLSANYMSVYGYNQKTTPFLEELAKTSLIVENAFPNASSTTASTTSLLTGKEPLTVNVLRYPNILSGNDSFEHLPGILKRQGYQTIEIGTPYFVDAQKLNLLDGFDVVNNRSLNSPVFDILRNVLGNSPSIYFIQTITERAFERLLHIYFIREMQDPLAGVNNPKSRMSDDERTDQIITLMDEAERPLFIFSHFMDTHGPEFSPKDYVFYGGSKEEIKDWDIDLYKDALLSYDDHVREVFDYLKESGKLDNTILVIYTDHGYGYGIYHRTPLIIHFPHNAYSGSRANNVQVLDIPVTLLDYIGLPIPEWMVGISMLGDEPPADRKIFSIRTGSPKKDGPPFYQVKIVQVIRCHRWYALNVQENKWESGVISKHTSTNDTTCSESLFPTDEQVRQWILDYLVKYNFDVSSLQ